MSFMTLLNLLNRVSGSALCDLPRIMRNVKVANIWFKIREIANNGANGAITTKNPNLLDKEYPPDANEATDLEVGHASASKLKNAKPAPHRVVARAREHKDDDDDDADADDADASGSN
jgi:hypothetical protein